MSYYIILGVFVGFLSFAPNTKRAKRNIVILTVAAMALLLGLRGDFTPDYTNYKYYFEYYRNRSVQTLIHQNIGQEIGFMLLTKFLSCFFDYQAYVFVIGGLTVGIIGYVMYKNCSMPAIALLFYISFGGYIDSFNIIRQSIAAAILFLGTPYLYERKLVKYILVCIAAAFFHSTTIFMIPFYFLLHSKIRKRQIFKIIAIAMVGWLFLPCMIRIVGRIIPRLAIYQLGTYGMTGGSIGYFVAPTVTGLAIWGLYYCGSMDVYDTAIDPRRRIQLNALLFSFIVSLFTTKAFLLNRIMNFFVLHSFMLVGDSLYACKNKANKKIVHVMIVIVSILYIYIALKGTDYDPYYFFWNNGS